MTRNWMYLAFLPLAGAFALSARQATLNKADDGVPRAIYLVTLGLCWSASLLYYLVERRRGKVILPPDHWLTVLGPLIWSVIPAIMWIGIRDAFLWAINPHASGWRYGVIGGGVVFFGAALFLFRRFFKTCYGVTETLVGVGVALFKVHEGPPELSQGGLEFYFAILTASVYLIVRGLSNIEEGLTKAPLDPIATRVWSWLKAESPDTSGFDPPLW